MQEYVIINQIHYDLDGILQDCWHRMINGANQARHPFHCASIATINGDFPEIRTVVLRKVIPEEKILIFHTDNRSPKLNQIRINNNISWLLYDAKSKIQIRLKTKATIFQHEETSLKRWNESRLESRRCYLVDPAPSVIIDFPTDGLPTNLDYKNITNNDLAFGYDNFAVIKNEVKEIDWLILNQDGHRRAQFIMSGNEIKKYWVIP